MNDTLRWLFVTDLDGSLLDNTYSWDEAREAVAALARLHIPLILNSSKTFDELLMLCKELNACAPLIAENGAVIGLPAESELALHAPSGTLQAGYIVWVPGMHRDHILGVAHQLRRDLGFRFKGFHDWSVQEVREVTGLDEIPARAAVHRRGTEPILWEDTPARWKQFVIELDDRGIRVLRGGRFMHLMGSSDKSDGLHAMKHLYKKAFPGPAWSTVALGDSANDLAMLNAADIAVVIPDRNGDLLKPSARRVIQACAPGPRGWNRTVLEILSDLEDAEIHG